VPCHPGDVEGFGWIWGVVGIYCSEILLGNMWGYICGDILCNFLGKKQLGHIVENIKPQ
jgi:hypothetical protein